MVLLNVYLPCTLGSRVASIMGRSKVGIFTHSPSLGALVNFEN